MATLKFAAKIEEWAKKVKGAETLVFQESVDELQKRLTETLTRTVYSSPSPSGYVKTGFLRASLVASNTAMPALTRENPGGSFTVDESQIEAVISGSAIGDTIYLGYTARYGSYVHYGANGRPPRPWVQLVAQQWSEIVAEKAAKVKKELGL